MNTHSYLFVPGDRPERFAKALASAADAVIIDLEDAVAPDRKDEAREQIAAWLPGVRPVFVRVNGCDTPWYEADTDLLCLPGIAGAMLPKTESQEALQALRQRLLPDRQLIALIETVAGWGRLRSIAATPGLARLAFGSVDFCADAGINGDDEELLLVRSALVLESRLAGIARPIDGVCKTVDDNKLLALEIDRARRMGFGAKLCIHPRQVEATNAGFAPTTSELAWAHRIDAAVAAHGLGACAVDGKLIDKAIWVQAQAILRQIPRPTT